MSTEVPSWVVALADQRIALMKEKLTKESMHGYVVIATPLTEPADAESMSTADFERWERCCDNCGVYCSPNREFFSGVLERELYGKQVILSFGACKRCSEVP